MCVILAEVSGVGGIECKIRETGRRAMMEVVEVGAQGDLGGKTEVSSFYVVDHDDVHSGCGCTPEHTSSLDWRHVQGRAAPLKQNALPGCQGHSHPKLLVALGVGSELFCRRNTTHCS